MNVLSSHRGFGEARSEDEVEGRGRLHVSHGAATTTDQQICSFSDTWFS